MSDLIIIAFTMAIVVYAGYFISRNDGDGNARPDKTLMAMTDDAPAKTRRSRFGTPMQPPPRRQ